MNTCKKYRKGKQILGPGFRKYLMTMTCLMMVLGHVIVVRYVFESVTSYDLS